MFCKILSLFLSFTFFIPISALKCDSGWTMKGSSCYLLQGIAISDGPMFDFQQAEGECVKKGAHLISVHNKVEQDFLTDWVKIEKEDCSRDDVWTGLNFDTKQQKAVFTDGSPVDFWKDQLDDSFGRSALVIQNSPKCSPIAPMFVQTDTTSKAPRFVCKKTAIDETQQY